MKSCSPEQEVYDVVFKILQSLAEDSPGFSVYTHNPPRGAKYPFVKPGMVQVVPLATKTALLATLHFDLDVWGDKEDRGKISAIALQILHSLSRVRKTESFHVEMNLAKSSYLVRPDQTSEEDLWVAEVTTEWLLQ